MECAQALVLLISLNKSKSRPLPIVIALLDGLTELANQFVGLVMDCTFGTFLPMMPHVDLTAFAHLK